MADDHEEYTRAKLKALDQAPRVNALLRELQEAGVPNEGIASMFMAAAIEAVNASTNVGRQEMVREIAKVVRNIAQRPRVAITEDTAGPDMEAAKEAVARKWGLDPEEVRHTGALAVEVLRLTRDRNLEPVTGPEGMTPDHMGYMQSAVRELMSGGWEPMGLQRVVLILKDDGEHMVLMLDTDEDVAAVAMYCRTHGEFHTTVFDEGKRRPFDKARVPEGVTLH